MCRKKVKLQWIANDATRRATFKKRRMGLMKKVEELSILCNVKACALVYSPYEPQPEVWPSAEEAAELLQSFRGMPEHEQARRRMNQESFLRQWAQKLRDQIEKERKVASKAQVELLLMECLRGARKLEDLGVEEVIGLGCLVEAKLKEVEKRLELLRGQACNEQALPPSRTDRPVVSAAMEASPNRQMLPLPSQRPPRLPPSSSSPPALSLPAVRIDPFLASSYSLLPTALQTIAAALAPPTPSCALPPPDYASVDAVGPNMSADGLYRSAAPTGSGLLTTPSAHRASGVQAAAATVPQLDGERRPDQLMEMMDLCRDLLCEEDDGMPPSAADGAKNFWMMDPYLP